MLAFALTHAHTLALIPFALGALVALTILGDCIVALIRIFRKV